MPLRLKSELDKLEEYLINHRITFERIDEDMVCDENRRSIKMDRHQICVPEEGKNCRWDAICHTGSYGCELGLLEIYGELVDEQDDGDSAVGFLTAEDVIKRIEAIHE